MLTKRAKAYSSSYSQTVSLPSTISSRFIFWSAQCSRRSQKSTKAFILKDRGLL